MARELAETGVDARLAESAGRGEEVEVILVVRGTVRRSARPGRWRIRLAGGGVLTFAAEWLVAATATRRATRR